ncbi:OmpH family outer membrane protein [Uliginosibacterium sp. H1]|nr:OmpH family outer membrane protein [Uliginosibacterium sp. H1]
MKRLLVRLLVLLCGAWLSTAATAQTDIKIGFVNADRVMRESAPAQRALKKLEREFEKRETELRNLEKQQRTLQEYLEKNNLTMNETERKQREREFADLSREVTRKQREYREDRSQRQNEELAAVLERANQAIRDVAKAEKYDLIVQDAVHHSPRIDITDKVIKVLADAPAR